MTSSNLDTFGITKKRAIIIAITIDPYTLNRFNMVPPYTSLTAILLAVSLVPRKTGAFVALPSINQHSRFMTRSFSVRQDFYHEPHFEVASPVQVDTINKSMDKMLECAQQGECSVEELDRMIAGTSERTLVSKHVIEGKTCLHYSP